MMMKCNPRITVNYEIKSITSSLRDFCKKTQLIEYITHLNVLRSDPVKLADKVRQMKIKLIKDKHNYLRKTKKLYIKEKVIIELYCWTLTSIHFVCWMYFVCFFKFILLPFPSCSVLWKADQYRMYQQLPCTLVSRWVLAMRSTHRKSE